MIFPFASCLPTERKMDGANAKLFAFYGLTNMTFLLFFSRAHYFSRKLFFPLIIRVSQVILSLKSAKNKKICQNDIMRLTLP